MTDCSSVCAMHECEIAASRGHTTRGPKLERIYGGEDDVDSSTYPRRGDANNRRRSKGHVNITTSWAGVCQGPQRSCQFGVNLQRGDRYLDECKFLACFQNNGAFLMSERGPTARSRHDTLKARSATLDDCLIFVVRHGFVSPRDFRSGIR